MDDFEQLDHYELLGLSRGASADEIKQAYRQQMRRYHPDRFAGAAPAEQGYASRRAQRINEAYQALGESAARNAYNRGLGGRAEPASRPPPAPPPPPRDHQAELYGQARAHLDAGRMVQAAATLRELQQLNPFYRDSAALLSQAEAATRPAAGPPAPADSGRRTLLVGGLGGLLLAGAASAAWWLRRPQASAADAGLSAAPTAAGVALAAPTALPTSAPTLAPTAAPTSAPTLAPTAAPTSAPTAAPTLAPTATAAPAPLAEAGELIASDPLGGGGAWPTIDNGAWSVGYGDGAYQIRADPNVGNIWAYGTNLAGGDLLVGVDVEVSGGEAGLLLRYSEAGSYLAFFIDPAAGSFRLEQRVAGQLSTVAAERSPALRPGEATNRIAALLQGERVALRINGQPVADLSLSAPAPTDRYGMVAVAGVGAVRAAFRNLALRRP